MATTPPPYADITGIYTTDDKHQAISRADYDGSAKPGQLVVDTADYSLWIGNDTGALNPVGGGGIPTRITNGDSEIDIPNPASDIVVTVNNTNVFDITPQGLSFSDVLYFADGNGAVIENNGGDLEIRNTGDDIIIDTRNGGDDILLYSGDRITLDAGDKAGNLDGGFVNIYAGDGGPDSGAGGDINIFAGSAGGATGPGGNGGTVEIAGGTTLLSGTPGGEVWIYAGGSLDSGYGSVKIGFGNVWQFIENDFTFNCPVATLAQLGSAVGKVGARAMINDSTVAASGNFGAIAADGGANIVPVFSDGTNWLIG